MSESERRGQRGDDNYVFGSPDPTASQQVEVQEVADSYFFLAENADALDASEMVEDSYYPFNSPDPSEGTLKTIQDIEEEVCDCRKGDCKKNSVKVPFFGGVNL